MRRRYRHRGTRGSRMPLRTAPAVAAVAVLAVLAAADLPPLPQKNVRFSFIGIPGLHKGGGWQVADGNTSRPVQSPCDPSMTGDPTDNLSGWLTVDSTGSNYTYVSGDYVTIDTDANAGPGSHAIQVGNQTYTIPTGQYNGFYVLVLERDSLCPASVAATVCTPPDPLLNKGYGQDNGGLTAMAADLKPYTTNPDLLLIVAPFIGSKGAMPGANPPEDLVKELRDFGSSPLAPGRAFATSSSRYALIGGGDYFGLPDGSAHPVVAESFTGFGQNGHIQGYLSRDHQNRFGPREVRVVGDTASPLTRIAYAPSNTWGADTSSKEFAFLSGKLGYPVTPDNPLGIRGAYQVISTDWDGARSDLEDWKWNDLKPQQRAALDETAYNKVWGELHDELDEVINVRGWVKLLQAIYLGSATYNVKPVADQVVAAIKASYPPPKAKASLALDLMHLFLGLASAIPPPVGPVFKVVGATLDFDLALARESDGQPQDVMGHVYDTAQEMQDAALTFLGSSGKSLNHLYAVVVSDPHKLDIVGHKTGPVGALPEASADHPWQITGDQANQLNTYVTTTLTHWLWPAVFNAGFAVWRLNIPSRGWIQ